MALLFDARFRAIDSDGNPLVGAVLFIKTANTSSPAAIFRNAALSTPMTNPTEDDDVSDAGGWFPQVFAAEGTLVDIDLKDADGNLIKSYEDVSFLGSDTGDFTRTVSGDGRFRITGSAGRVSLQAGDPDPDDTGGELTLEGWAGTQLDELLLDAAVTDTTGRINEIGKKLTGVVATDATTLGTPATSQIIPLANDPVGCRAWRVDIFDLTAAAGVTLVAQLSFDGGATYKSTNEYDGWMWGRENGGAVAESVTGPTTAGQIGTGIINTNKLMWITLEILSPLSGTSSQSTVIRGDMIAMTNETTDRMTRFFSAISCQSASQGRPTHLKITAGSNIDFKYRVAPQRGYGEA